METKLMDDEEKKIMNRKKDHTVEQLPNQITHRKAKKKLCIS